MRRWLGSLIGNMFNDKTISKQLVFNADALAADNADVLAADHADVLAADTTDVLAADITPCSCWRTNLTGFGVRIYLKVTKPIKADTCLPEVVVCPEKPPEAPPGRNSTCFCWGTSFFPEKTARSHPG